MPSRSTLLLSIVLMLPACAAYAGQAPAQPKPRMPESVATTPIPSDAVLMIYRAEVKPGHTVAQQKAAAATARASAKIEGMPTFLAMTAVAGPSEVWFLTPYQSMAEIDKLYEAFDKVPAAQLAELDQIGDQEGAHYNAMRSVLARYRGDMSLDASFNVAPYRSMSVTIYRVRLGQERQFAEAAKKVIAAYKKAIGSFHIAGFEVVAGAPSGTFLFMRPMKMAAELLPTAELRKAYVDALGQDVAAQLDKAQGDMLVSQEQFIFTFSPKMSSLPASYAAADPFWRITAPAMAKPGEPQKKAAEPVKK